MAEPDRLVSPHALFAFASQQPWMGAVCFAVATTLRSNGILLAGFLAYDALQRLQNSPGDARRRFRGLALVSAVAFRAIVLAIQV